MFHHQKHLQYHSKPERPDPLYAKQLQELLGGQWGEMSVMISYLFQGWNCRGPDKYRDMLLDIGTEEIGHVEMLATMIARLLEGASDEDQQAAAAGNPMVGAVLGGSNPKEVVAAAAMDPRHIIVAGQGASPTDSVGYPWNSRYTIASGNLLADFRYNLAAESQGRLQAARLYHMTDDPGVRDMLSFLIARDTMHQNQWLAALEELQADGLETTPAPSAFPQELEKNEVAYRYMSFSESEDGSTGRWVNGPSPDGKGTFEYESAPAAYGEAPSLNPGDPNFFSTPKRRK